jgi:primary-amine oxidase
VNLTTETLELNVRLGPNLHAPGDGDEIIAIERLALEDEGVQAAIAKLQLPEGSQIVVDPWIYGKCPGVSYLEATTDGHRRCRWR